MVTGVGPLASFPFDNTIIVTSSYDDFITKRKRNIPMIEEYVDKMHNKAKV